MPEMYWNPTQLRYLFDTIKTFKIDVIDFDGNLMLSTERNGRLHGIVCVDEQWHCYRKDSNGWEYLPSTGKFERCWDWLLGRLPPHVSMY
jgi:hypothetical protein